jgi:hypothetical protein
MSNTIYQLSGEDRYVSVSPEYTERLQELVQEYGEFRKVPPSQTVRAMFVKSDGSGGFQPENGLKQENDVAVCMLTVPEFQ